MRATCSALQGSRLQVWLLLCCSLLTGPTTAQAPLITGLVQANQHALAAEYCASLGLDPGPLGVLPDNVQAQLTEDTRTYLQLPLPSDRVVLPTVLWGRAGHLSLCLPWAGQRKDLACWGCLVLACRHPAARPVQPLLPARLSQTCLVRRTA